MMVFLLRDVLIVQMSTKQSLVHYPHQNASGVNTFTTVPIIILAFNARDVHQDPTAQQGKKLKFSRQAVLIYMTIHLVHRDYIVVKVMPLHARVPVLHNVPLVVGNSHLMKDVISAQQEHTKMERC